MDDSISKRVVSSIALVVAALSILFAGLTAQAHPAGFIVINPGDSIQAAIDSANNGDVIVIHAGTYTESLTLNKAVSLLGDDRATTIVGAASAQRVMTITGAAISNTVMISGLTFAHGNMIGSGGGILIAGNARPLLENLIVAENQASVSGGGIYADVGSPLILINVNVISNTAAINTSSPAIGGGGVWGTDVSVDGGRFENNASVNSRGGGLYADKTLTLTGTQFISNSASFSGGGAHVMGTTVALNGWFEHNRSNDGGGGGGLRAGQVLMTNTAFISNAAINTSTGGGGALVVNSSGASSGAAVIVGGQFVDNVTDNRGGGLTVFGSLALTGTTFVNNAAQAGGGLSVEHDGDKRVVNAVLARNKAGSGAAIFVSLTSGRVDILHTTITSPTLGAGAAIVIGQGAAGITNTIIANYATDLQAITGTVYADYNLYFGNTVTTTGSIDGGAHNVYGDPKFVAPANDDYHLMIDSAAIDRGVDAGVPIDFDGRPRVGVPDIGAYEKDRRVVYLPLVRK